MDGGREEGRGTNKKRVRKKSVWNRNKDEKVKRKKSRRRKECS